MIQYRFTDKDPWKLVTPTIFPDGTSQIWKLNFLAASGNFCEIKWNFESEAEIMHISQLRDLLETKGINNISLFLPYFPYARQDKEVSNESTFAKTTFCKLIFGFRWRTTYDVHSEKCNIPLIDNKRPDHFLKAIADYNPDAIFFPDHGAMTRYQKMFLDSPEFNIIPRMYGEKIRNQQTGEITDYKVYAWKDNHDGERVLILDDICDGGATFINAARELKKIGIKEIGLCVSHGIFSKGLIPLWQADIRTIYTTDSFPCKTMHLEPDEKNVHIYKIGE